MQARDQWDATARETVDEDRFRRLLGGVEEADPEACRRVPGDVGRGAGAT